MPTLAERCGVHDSARARACALLRKRVSDAGIHQVRVAWADAHGVLRAKTLMPDALDAALTDGVGMVGTLLLKDTADRTAWPVFEPGGAPAGFAGAANLWLLPDPDSFCDLPWAPGTGWLQAQPWFADGTPVLQDSRRVLQRAVARLADHGWHLRCGLEVEFHVYRITDARLDPAASQWPPDAPEVELIHPGWQLLSEAHADQVEPVFDLIRHTAQGLGLPLRSLEIELGPSQVEAVFDAQHALAAADAMVRFRNGVKQALRRAGYHASFICRPPFANAMASGWHLHHSVVDAQGRNVFMATAVPADGANKATRADRAINATRAGAAAGTAATHSASATLAASPAGADAAVHAESATRPDPTLSPMGQQWLAGLLAHAPGAAVFGTSTANGFGRFKPNALAPLHALWGRDNRGAMLRLIGTPGDPATRLENRIGEPAANPYAYIAAQIHAGLGGVQRGLTPPPPTDSPYAPEVTSAAASAVRSAVASSSAPTRTPPPTALPASLGAALDALQADATLCADMGAEFVEAFVRIKRQEAARRDAADDADTFDRREYFGRL